MDSDTADRLVNLLFIVGIVMVVLIQVIDMMFQALPWCRRGQRCRDDKLEPPPHQLRLSEQEKREGWVIKEVNGMMLKVLPRERLEE